MVPVFFVQDAGELENLKRFEKGDVQVLLRSGDLVAGLVACPCSFDVPL